MKQKTGRIWTVGHSNRSIEAFLEMLRAAAIELVADVRRFPGSRRCPQFGRESLADSLRSVGIGYEHLEKLGGRRRAEPNSVNTAWRNAAFRGYADYMQSSEFRSGIDRLLELATEKRVAIMCAEALWWQCHRGLIADFLKANGWKVIHILSPTKLEEHPFTSAARLEEGRLSYRSTEPELNLEASSS